MAEVGCRRGDPPFLCEGCDAIPGRGRPSSFAVAFVTRVPRRGDSIGIESRELVCSSATPVCGRRADCRRQPGRSRDRSSVKQQRAVDAVRLPWQSGPSLPRLWTPVGGGIGYLRPSCTDGDSVAFPAHDSSSWLGKSAAVRGRWREIPGRPGPCLRPGRRMLGTETGSGRAADRRCDFARYPANTEIGSGRAADRGRRVCRISGDLPGLCPRFQDWGKRALDRRSQPSPIRGRFAAPALRLPAISGHPAFQVDEELGIKASAADTAARRRRHAGPSAAGRPAAFLGRRTRNPDPAGSTVRI